MPVKKGNIPWNKGKKTSQIPWNKGINFIHKGSFKKGHKPLLDSKGSNNPIWKGDNVKYDALHHWVRRHKPKSELCENCKISKPHDLANISGKYLRDINDFEWLCRKCHMKKDGRLDKFIGYKKIRVL